ncbi:MipA/OmpV family protein [Pseudoalteromonas mariniglutinosa]|uniref:MipA/OmpV family protein n=1 Tax=Pseudoalteromonas mariniglutinosa TaxID=206042 RepID=UPI00384EEDA2
MLVFLGSLVLSLPCYADAAIQRDSSRSATPAEQIQTEHWHVSLSLGLGVMTNPLNGGSNLPLVVVPEIAYYGEQWFFDNGRLGYSFHESAQHVFNLVSEFNPETRFFVDLHPSNIFALQSSVSSTVDLTTELDISNKFISTKEIDKRKWALDAGLSYHYINEQHVFSVQTLADISGVYKGYRSALQWQAHQQVGSMHLKSSLGVWFKSAQLNDYFYGLSAAETQLEEIQVGSGWQPYAKIDARWPLSNANALRFHLAYYDYSAVKDSPLFEHTYSVTVFIGFDHIF